MRAFALFILHSRLRAMLVTMVAAALSMIFPPFGHVSGATVGLVTLRNGWREGLLVVGGSAVVLYALGLMSTMGSMVIVSFVLALVMVAWIPVIVCAMILRRSRSLGRALTAAGLLAAAGLAGFYLAVDDIPGWWQQVLTIVVRPMLETSQTSLSGAEIDSLLQSMASVMTGLLAATVVYSIMINLFLARWWQALVFNPGGFREEFLFMRLDWRMAVVALLVMALASFSSGQLAYFARDLLLLIATVCSFQGLALAHAVVVALGLNPGWLLGLYLMLVLALLKVGMVLSALGLTDSVLDFRQRFRLTGRLQRNHRPGDDQNE